MKSAEIEMLRRECKIVNNDNPTAQVLTVCFLKPKELKGGEFVATAKLSCVYFEESIEC